MPTTPKFKPGEHVILLPFEDQPQEEAIVDEYEGNNLYCVTLLPKYRSKDPKDRDDGIRECDVDQMRKVPRGRRRKK